MLRMLLSTILLLLTTQAAYAGPIISNDSGWLHAGEDNIVHVTGGTPGARVLLMTSNVGPGVGPCGPGGVVCFDIIPPLRRLITYFDAAGEVDITYFVPNILAGRTVWIQAIDAGVPVVSNVLELDIAMDIPGCTEVTATNYDAMATSDDGSCTYCSGISADIKTSADVALYDGCTELYELYIDNTSGLFSVDLPQLELVTTYLSVNGNADLQFVNLPMLREVGDYAYIATNSALESVDLSGLEYSEGLYVNTNDVLQSIDLMSLTSILYYVNIISNPVLCLDAAIDWATISPGGYYVDSPGCAGLSCELTNAGFEDGVITPWVTSSASITTDSWEGTYAALIDGNNYIKQYFDVPVPVSELVSATFYTWHDTTDSPAMSTEWGYSDLSTGSGYYGSGELDGWQQHDMLADLDPSKELDYILIWGYSGGGALADITLVDAVSFCR